jgi:hypothetical protein
MNKTGEYKYFLNTLSMEVDTNSADKRRPLGRPSSLAD